MKKSKLHPTSIGSLVLCGILLVIVSLIFFQSSFFFNQPVRFVAYFDEAIQGLAVGSSVKLRGVTIGHVVSTSIQYDWETYQSKVVVIGELNKKAMQDASGKLVLIATPSLLTQLIQHGLYAKIALLGITGLQFVELDFLNTKKPLAPIFHTSHSEATGKADGTRKAMNSDQGCMSPYCSDQNTSLTQYPSALAKPQTERHEISGLATTTVNTTSYPMIPTLNSGMSELTDDLVALAKNARKIDFAKLSTSLTTTTEELSTLVSNLNKETKDLPLKKMIQQITAAASSLKRLADYLDQNPSALLFGRKSK